MDDSARAHHGHHVAPVDDRPLMVAFASAADGLAAARELAGGLGARVAAVTGEAEPRAGSYKGAPAAEAVRLLKMAAPRQVVIDDATAETINGRLPPEIGLAEVADASSPTGTIAWVSLRRACRSRHAPRRVPIAGSWLSGPRTQTSSSGGRRSWLPFLERLLESGFMAVVGASGSGKSSLVRAGLVPAYRRVERGASWY